MAGHSEADQGRAQKFEERREPPQDDGFAVAGVCIFLAAIVWVVFSQTLRHGFVNYDDSIYVYQNPVVMAGLTRRGILWALTYGGIGHWHPVTWFSHMLDWRLFGPWAGGHHLTSVTVHGATAILLFLAVKQMTGALWRSAMVAAVFAIHPQRVESVAWIAERKDVLSGLFFMATILAYVRYVRQAPSAWRYALFVILFALGLMSKNMLVTLPLVLVLLDYWPLRRLTPEMVGSIRQPESRAQAWRLIAEKIPLFFLSAASCVMTILSPEKLPPGLQFPLLARTANAIVSYVIYVKQMLYPAGLILPYFNPPGGLPPWQVFGALALLIAVSAVALLFWRSHPYLLVGWLWYLGMTAPVIGLLQMSYAARADRYTYLPQIGLYIMAIWGSVELLGRSRAGRSVLITAGLLVLAALVPCAQTQASYWRNSETLWTHVLKESPTNHIALNNLALVVADNGQNETAIGYFAKAVEIQPTYDDAHNNLGSALSRAGRLREAIEQHEKAVELRPDIPEFQNNLGTALAQNGQLTEALPHFRKAVELNPYIAEAHSNLGHAFLTMGKEDEAEREFLKALELRPGSAEIHKHLASFYLKQERTADAIMHYQKVLEITPDDTEARRSLDRALSGRLQ